MRRFGLNLFVVVGLMLGFGASTAFAQCELDKLTASDPESGGRFGNSVAISGDVAIIGAAYSDGNNGVDSGAAYIFRRSGSTWIEEQKIFAADVVAGDYFGIHVALSGETAVITAHWDDDNGNRSGSAYVFGYDGAVWNQVAKLLPSDGEAEDQFGTAVSISIDTIIIGASRSQDQGPGTGSAYVFEKPSDGWVNMTESAKLTASDATEDDNFGAAAAISGDIVIVGAGKDDDNGRNSGSVYVFVKPKAGWASAAWPMNESEKLTPSDAVPGQYFGGSAVAISGDTTVIAAMFDDDNSGAAYVFVNCGGSWVQQAKLLASDGEAWDWFGYSVAISGDTIIVGADQNYNNGPGVAYVFKKPLTGWEDNMTEDAKLTASDGAATDDFGVSVAISGDTALIGTFEDDDNFNNSGSAYIFAVGGDCNDNGVVDQCEIADGASQDSNEDGVPDECQNCAADLNGDGVVGPADLAILLASWGTCVK